MPGRKLQKGEAIADAKIDFQKDFLSIFIAFNGVISC